MSTFNSLLYPLVEPATGLELFALRPLFIAGMTLPVVDGDAEKGTHLFIRLIFRFIVLAEPAANRALDNIDVRE